jgi:hypothetical protein
VTNTPEPEFVGDALSEVVDIAPDRLAGLGAAQVGREVAERVHDQVRLLERLEVVGRDDPLVEVLGIPTALPQEPPVPPRRRGG